MEAVCGNNPVDNQDSSGQFWDLALDVVFTVGSLIAVAKNPTDLKAWAALGADLICTFIPFATGGGIAVRAASKVDDVIDAGRAMNKAELTVKASEIKKIHGNSLQSQKETVGYVLRKIETGEILKYGETSRGSKRYTKKFYKENGAYMDIMAKGSKYEMHHWQHKQILDYYNKNGHKPPLNKSFW